jgi:hypothetical protein
MSEIQGDGIKTRGLGDEETKRRRDEDKGDKEKRKVLLGRNLPVQAKGMGKLKHRG